MSSVNMSSHNGRVGRTCCNRKTLENLSTLPNNFSYTQALKAGISNPDRLVKQGYLEKNGYGKYAKSTKQQQLTKKDVPMDIVAKDKTIELVTEVFPNSSSDNYQESGKIPFEMLRQKLNVAAFMHLFINCHNADKAKLISTLFPMATEAELLAKFDELYPNYILPNVKEGDILFHPLIGKVKIEKASPKKLGFYGNGQAWEADRNGHLIVNGKTHDRRTLFIDFADYQKYMEESMI